ncbi:DUF3500 domain-containing protein [Methylococcus sp. EFPC2]|uniref:DUF3500 domain-containing protein n=1 Tax=Methylococcus sp. EFPC2 TaxID=2812648 RepID=UPI0019670558|nr:DUF3500 domain-containing protein [Methylococcus sp. EFPC2]QSA96577.1 DUF3500 domain-containing protein [Methylococcus sp. EFPC2]
MRVLFFVVVLMSLAFEVMALDQPHASAGAAARMRAAAEHVLATLPEPARSKALRPFDDRDRYDWHYIPRERKGVSFKDLDANGRAAVHALLKQALSAAGHAKVVNIIELELVLRELEASGPIRDPERYHLTIYGTPDPKAAWGWRFEGHHLSLNFTLAGDRLAVDTPSFFGANPATVRQGPKKGLRVLADEEDEARKLLALLTPEQRATAVFSPKTYGEIVTGAAEQVTPLDPVGVAAAQLDDKQRAQLIRLIAVYADNFEPGLTAARMTRVREGGIENIRFGWAGSTERGHPHYYRVQGPLFLIEYDSTQNDGNHIHSVWRDYTGDFGRDLLRDHYLATRSTGTPDGHRHP